jgi:hypothetical protein
MTREANKKLSLGLQGDDRMRPAKVITLVIAVLVLLCAPALAAKQDQELPKDFGFYAKTGKGFQRIIPNIIFDQDGLLYIESNEPPHFSLNEIEYFLVYGKRDVTYLTLNPLLFVRQSPLGKMRFVFGKDIAIEVKKMGETLYSIKPQGLFGRGYYSFWLDDLVWDFIVE